MYASRSRIVQKKYMEFKIRSAAVAGSVIVTAKYLQDTVFNQIAHLTGTKE